MNNSGYNSNQWFSMKIGILSETHGHVERTKSAMEILINAGVERVLHCGDIGSDKVMVELYSSYLLSQIPIYAVLGNVDYPDDDYLSWNKRGEIYVYGRFGKMNLAGKDIAIIHGDDSLKLEAAIHSNAYDYIFTGHTHIKRDDRIGKSRIINPGAVYRASKPTVACLDLNGGELQYLPLLQEA